MKPQRSAHTDPQRDLFRVELKQLVDPRHPLVQLADQIQWEQFQAAFAQWVENPYWQYFCGGKFFEDRLPIHPSSMTRRRGHLQEAGAEKMLAELIVTGLRGGLIRPTMLQRVNMDTTVQEKCIRFPTDARLYDRMRERLVKLAQPRGCSPSRKQALS